MASRDARFGAFEQALLHALGAPLTTANLRALEAWRRAEGGSASWNYFNTTQPEPGASSYNSAHVRNYTSFQQGLHATIDTLRNGHYAAILAALHRGANPLAVAQAIGSSPWGTSGSLVAEILGGRVATPTVAPSSPRPGAGGGSTPQTAARSTTLHAAPVLPLAPSYQAAGPGAALAAPPTPDYSPPAATPIISALVSLENLQRRLAS